jgi:DNA-binding SARP family transcriptional activator
MGAISASSGLEIRRDALLRRLDAARPKIVALVAPAGFGKSTLARQLIASKSSVAICDAADAAGDLDLARRLIPALAAETPQRTRTLTQRELMMGDPGMSVADRVNLALEAWKEPVEDSTFVFENAEYVARDAPAREFFGRLLAQRPAGRTVVICSREPLRVHLTRFAPPHEILTLRAEDLAFDRSELTELFGAQADNPSFLSRIMQLSQGWPIAVFLLRRFAGEGRLDSLLESLNDVAFEELHDYLADQVLASLEPELVNALFSCACIPNAHLADLRAALSDERAVTALQNFAKESPFVMRAGEAFVLHPLLASLLLERRAERRDTILSRVASAHALGRRYQRAAELHLARGDQEAAAEALGRHEVIRDRAPSMEYARVLASLDHALVQRYPRLWAVTAMLRMFCIDSEELLDEAESLWRTLSPDVSPSERSYVLLFRVMLMSYIGLIEEGEALLAGYLGTSNGDPRNRDYVEAYLGYVLGVIRSRMGRLAQAERDLTVALPHVGGTDVAGSGALLTLGADIARARGEFAVARQFIDRALESARRSGLSNFIAFDLAEACFGAWFSGDENAFVRYGVELDELVHRNGVRGLAFFAAAARGRAEQPGDADLLKFVACGRMIAAASCSDRRTALRHARAAVTAAQQLHSPFTECLAFLTLAAYDEDKRSEAFEAAIASAARCESPALQNAVRAAAEGRADFGMLNAFMTRLQHERADTAPPLEVLLTRGVVRASGHEVALSEREFALLVALSIRRENVPRARLTDLLWPELDEYAARNALSVCLHRLRQRLGSNQTVARGKDGYALHDDVRVDLWDIDRAVTSLRSRPVLGDTERALLAGVFENLRQKRPERMLQWDWFEPTERHIRELRLEVAHRLASDALSHGHVHQALELAEEMIGYDPCDEAGRELAITAHLRRGDRAAAMRQYRQYRETLLAELQCEPSEELKQLVGLTQHTA